MPEPLGNLVCRQLLRKEHTTSKEVRHGCSIASFNHNGAASIRIQEKPIGDHLFYSVALFHADGRKLTPPEIEIAQRRVSDILDHHGVGHSIACIDSHYDILVARHQRISAAERHHPDTDEEHLDHLAHRYATAEDSGLAQITFRITPTDETNVDRLLEAMSSIRALAPDRAMGKNSRYK